MPLRAAEAPAWVVRYAGPLVLTVAKFRATRGVYVMTGLAEESQATSLAVQNAVFTLRYYRELFLHPRRSSIARGELKVRSANHFFEAAANGRGVIIVTAHLGDFEIAAEWLRRHVEVVSAAVDRRWAFRQHPYDWARRVRGIHLRSGRHGSLVRLKHDLAAGGVVVTMVDRRPRRRGAAVTFFGRPARASRLAEVLSRWAGAPVLVATITQSRSCCRTLEFWTITRARTSIDRENPRSVTQLALDRLEHVIRRAPAEWHVPANPSELIWVKPSESADQPGHELTRERGRPVATVRRPPAWYTMSTVSFLR